MFAAMLAYALASLLYVSGTTKFFRVGGNTSLVAGISLLALLAQNQLLTHGNWVASAAPLLAAMIGVGAIAADRWLGVRLAAAVLAPLGMLVLLVRFFVAPAPQMAPTMILTGIHVGMAVAGQVMAIAVCVLSVLYWRQHNALKHHKILELGPDVPALDRLDHWLKIALVSGFIMLTCSLVTGALFVTALPQGNLEALGTLGESSVSGALLALRTKILWAIAVWSWYLAILVARNILRSPPRIVAQMSAVGFALMAVAWFGLIFFVAEAPKIAG